MKWISVDKCVLKDLPVQSIDINGKRICLVKTANKYFATETKCPHAGADISQGWCENDHLVCPFHRYKYNLETGRGIEGQGDYITIYPVKEEKEQLLIGIKENWFKKLFNF